MDKPKTRHIMSCCYYGKSHVAYNRTGQLIDQGGNECGIYVDAFSPCVLEVNGEDVDEEECVRFHLHQMMLIRLRGYCDCHPPGGGSHGA